MAKYVCDTDVVREVANKLVEIAETIKSKLDDYKTNIEADTAGWNGDLEGAKNAFNNTNQSLVTYSEQKIIVLAAFGEFLGQVVDALQEIEETLAALKV